MCPLVINYKQIADVKRKNQTRINMKFKIFLSFQLLNFLISQTTKSHRNSKHDWELGHRHVFIAAFRTLNVSHLEAEKKVTHVSRCISRYVYM